MNETKQVPVEPTDEMVDEAMRAHDEYIRDNQSLRVSIKVMYEAMLAAAPAAGDGWKIKPPDDRPKKGGWWNTSLYDFHDPEAEVRYLDLRGLLEHHPDHPEWVRVKGEKS